jgi:hypothetical protein
VKESAFNLNEPFNKAYVDYPDAEIKALSIFNSKINFIALQI